MKTSFVTNRTFWHSGLLFILLFLIADSKIQIGYKNNEGALTIWNNGARFNISDLDVLDVVCQMSDKDNNVLDDNSNSAGVIKWSLNGNSISSKNLISDSDAIQLDKEIFSEPRNKLECFVTNKNLFRTSSYAFVYIVKSGDEVQDDAVGYLTLTVNEGDPVMKQGARVSLQCKVSESVDEEGGEVLPEFSWLKNAEKLNLATSQNFDVKVISGLEQHLVLDNVSVSDAGNYGCLVSGPRDLYDETSLSVEFAPIFDISTEENELSVKASESAEMSCQVVSAFPAVIRFSWAKDGNTLNCDENNAECSIVSSDAKTTISFPDISPKMSGSYECHATNDAGSSTRRRILKVNHDPPKISQVLVKGESSKIMNLGDEKFLILEDSNEILLECLATGWPTPSSVTFTRSGVKYSNPMTIEKASKENHQGIWECLAENSYGESDRKSVEILIASKTSFKRDSSLTDLVQAHVGHLLSLDCAAEVDEHLRDSSKIVWSKDGIVFENEAGNKLFVKNVTDNGLETTGIYECRVQTALDHGTRQWDVRVVQSPFVAPTFPDKIVALFGQPLHISCYALGIPEPTSKWILTGDKPSDDFLKNSFSRQLENVPDNVKPVDLNVESLSIKTTGFYQCFTENEHGKSELGVWVVGAQPTEPIPEFQNETIISARAGDSVELGCEVIVDPVLTNVAPVRRFWEKDGKILEEFGEKLTIPYLVGREHTGTYSCIVDTSADRIILVQRLKVITAPPVIERFSGNSKTNSTKKPSEYFVLRGNNLTVNCDIIKGIPFPQISWKKNLDESEKHDETIPFQTTSTFGFTDVEPSDEGEYGCLAVNEYGSDQKNFRLVVLEPTTIPARQDETLAETFGDVKFQCLPEVDPRIVAQISWFKNHGQSIIGSGSELVLRNVTKKDDGHYICVAETDYDASNTTFRLSVAGETPTFISTEKDVRALEGSNVTVSCQANGLPLPKISWFRDGAPIADRRFSVGALGDLTMTSLSLSDAGEYSCRAENIYGISETISNVEVLRRADAGSRESGNAVVKNVGENASLVCDVSFDPRLRSETRVRWFYKNEEKGSTVTPIFDASKFTTKKIKTKFETKDNILKIQDLKVEDKGVYECLVETPFEKISYSVNLFVNGEAPKILSEFKKRTLYEGEALVLGCLVRGSPRPTLRWFFNDRPLPANLIEESIETASPEFRESRVKIASVSKRDDGVYQCETSNLYGSGVAKFAKVTVIGRTNVRIGSAGSDPEKEIVVHAGEKLKIPCRVENDPGNRITNITWEKDGNPITVSSEDRIDFGMDGSVTIANVQKRHGGIYRCTATTVLDSANDTVPLRVVVNAPVITSRSPAKQIVFDGDSLALLCNANGIPEPKISWVFNKTRTNVVGSEYRVNKAISSDTGEYICEAKNAYGETRHAMEVEVIILPHFHPEMFVDKGSRADLSCVTEIRPDIEVFWQKDFKDILDDNLTINPNGTLTIKSVTDNSTGVYMCTVATKGSPGNRRRILQTSVRLRPVILTSMSGPVNVIEGSDTALSCLVVPGLEAKRLWRFNGDFFAHDARRDLKKRGERLEIRGTKLSDSGNYSCVAIAPDGERDTVHFDLRVIPRPITLITTPTSIAAKGENLSLAECSSQPLTIVHIYRLDNSTVQVEWTDNGLDRSCFSSVSIVWWTNVSEASTGISDYLEKEISLSDKKVSIGITVSQEIPTEIHYVQANLVGPLNVQIYGETRSFIFSELTPIPELSSGLVDPNSATGENDPLLLRSGYPVTTVVVVALVIIFLVAFAITIGLFIYRKKYSKNPEPLETVCLWRRECCSCFGFGNSSRASQNSARFGKTNFNGFDRGAFEGAIIISSPMAVVGPGIMPDEVLDDDVDDDEYDNGRANLQRHSRYSVYRGSAYLSGAKNGANFVQSNADFMSNLAPQWPEPEEPVSASLANIHVAAPLHEREPFLAPKRHRYTSPGRTAGGGGGRGGGGENRSGSSKKRSSKESISSSWSSLFNVPAVSTTSSPAREIAAPFASSSVAIRPNSTTSPVVSNNSDPPPQVTSFMNNHKHRNV